MGTTKVKDDVVLEVEDLRTVFNTRWGTVKAVDGVSFKLHKGETLGIVGESGSGKSVTALSLMRLVPSPPGHIVGGKVILDGQNILQLSENKMGQVRGSKIGIILQDPMTSLNPVFSIGNQVEEAIRIHQQIPKKSVLEKALDVLRKVRIPAPEARVKDYPHQMSGGMRQRVVGAISISCQPLVLIADEPTTSLDVTIQAQYLRLLNDIQEESDLALIFITHDFGVEEDVEKLYSIEGQPPTLHDLPTGCPFAPRCPYVMDRCREEYPPRTQVGNDHFAHCWKLE